jgi:hypothetical protein
MEFISIHGLFLLVLGFVVFAAVIMEFRYILKYAEAKSVSVSLPDITEYDSSKRCSFKS